jgi:hypothetical protein
MNIDNIQTLCDAHLVTFNGIWLDSVEVNPITKTAHFLLQNNNVITVDAQSLDETDSDSDGVGGYVYVMRDVRNVHQLVRFYASDAIKVD